MASPANIRDMARVPLGVVQARKAINGFRPDVVLATGWYVAVPAGLAARRWVRKLAVVTGNPVRPEVMSGSPDKAMEALGLRGFDRRLPTLYVTGGAQGAQQINDVVRDALPWLLERANVVHQCGPAHIEGLRRHAAGMPPDGWAGTA